MLLPPGNKVDNNLYVQPTDPYGIYTDAVIDNRYYGDDHLYMLGITSPGGFNGQSVGFVQLSASTLLWVCDWTVARVKNRPNIPNPQPADSGWQLLSTIVEPAMVNVAADGYTPVYRISGIYVYGHRNPANAVLAHGRPPWLQDKLIRIISTDQLEKSISDVAQPNQGGITNGGNNNDTEGDLGFVIEDDNEIKKPLQ